VTAIGRAPDSVRNRISDMFFLLLRRTGNCSVGVDGLVSVM
jgi:hypothetical protein